MKVKRRGLLAGALVLAHAWAAFGGINVWTETGPLAADVRAAEEAVAARWTSLA